MTYLDEFTEAANGALFALLGDDESKWPSEDAIQAIILATQETIEESPAYYLGESKLLEVLPDLLGGLDLIDLIDRVGYRYDVEYPEHVGSGYTIHIH